MSTVSYNEAGDVTRIDLGTDATDREYVAAVRKFAGPINHYYTPEGHEILEVDPDAGSLLVPTPLVRVMA